MVKAREEYLASGSSEELGLRLRLRVQGVPAVLRSN
jgi:hypothetical protein